MWGYTLYSPGDERFWWLSFFTEQSNVLKEREAAWLVPLRFLAGTRRS